MSHKLEIIGTVMARINQCWIIENDYGHFDVASDAELEVGKTVKLCLVDSPNSNEGNIDLIVKSIYVDKSLRSAQVVFQNAFFGFNIQNLLSYASGINLYNTINTELFSMHEGELSSWIIVSWEAEDVDER